MSQRTMKLSPFLLLAVGIVGIALFPVVRSKLSERWMAASVAAMRLPPGASARVISPPMILVRAGYEIRLRPFDASRPATLDQTIYGVPDTGSHLTIFWRIPASQEGIWKKSESQISYKLTIGNKSFAGHVKWKNMIGMETGMDHGSIYLYDMPGILETDIPAGTPIRLQAIYEPAAREPLNYQVEPIVTSGGHV